jgi:hypothetical protein
MMAAHIRAEPATSTKSGIVLDCAMPSPDKTQAGGIFPANVSGPWRRHRPPWSRITKHAACSSTDQSGGKRRAGNVHSIATFGRCHRLFNGGMAPLFRIKDRYQRIWISFLYLLCGLFSRVICFKSGLQLSVDGHVILFDERHRSAYWR